MKSLFPSLLLLCSLMPSCGKGKDISAANDSTFTATDHIHSTASLSLDCVSADSLLSKFKYYDLRTLVFDSLDTLIEKGALIPLSRAEYDCIFQGSAKVGEFGKYGNMFYFYSNLAPRGPYYSFVIAAHVHELFKGFELIHLDSNLTFLDHFTLLAEGGEEAGWVISKGGFTSDSTFEATWQRGWQDSNLDSLGRDSVVINLTLLANGHISESRAEHKWKIKSNW